MLRRSSLVECGSVLHGTGGESGTLLIFKVIGQRSMSPGQIFTAWHPCEHSRIKILQWILTKPGTDLVRWRVWNHIDSRVFTRMLRSKNFTVWHFSFDIWPWKSIGFQTLQRTKCMPSLVKIHWRILILECSQGILTKHGTYIVHRKVWNPVDFQG
jgi:hypothetical protein